MIRFILKKRNILFFETMFFSFLIFCPHIIYAPFCLMEKIRLHSEPCCILPSSQLLLTTDFLFVRKPYCSLFLVFLEFLDSWAWDSKNLEKNQINQKNKKTNPEWTYPRFFSQDCFFLFFFVFFGFPRVFGQLGLGQQKPREKPNKPKKTKKPILNGLTQDSSHRIVFFCFFFGFPRVFGQLGLGTPKNLEKNEENQKKQKNNLE